MDKLRITIACDAYDRVQALIDGTVRVEGCQTIVLPLHAEEAFHRAYVEREFEVSELSMSSYLTATARGDCPYVAIPVFLSRVFRHSAIYVRADGVIRAPADLRGRVVGVPEYQMTAALWVRGMLSDVYGVRAEEIRWRTGGLEQPGRTEKIPLTLPAHFDVAQIPPMSTLSAMLAAGEIDALVSARAPSCFNRNPNAITRLFADYRTAEREYFTQTGLFPIMHVVGIRRDVAAANPWLPASLYKAFGEAKAVCMPRLGEVGVLAVTLPWLFAEYEATRALMGDDYWPYGIDENRPALDAMVRYAFEQGLTPRPLSVDELFVEGTRSRHKL